MDEFMKVLIESVENDGDCLRRIKALIYTTLPEGERTEDNVLKIIKSI